MTAADAARDAHCRGILAEYADLRLTTLPDGRRIGLRDAWLPPLVNYTHEDKAAKGLRSLTDAATRPQDPVYFSALEMVDALPFLVLEGETGSGKSTFARRLALHLAGAILHAPHYSLEGLAQPVARNDNGPVLAETWSQGVILPLLIEVQQNDAVDAVLDRIKTATETFASASPALVIVDAIERLGRNGERLVAGLVNLCATRPHIRMLLLGDIRTTATWMAPPGVARLRLLPFNRLQTETLLRALGVVNIPQEAKSPLFPGPLLLSLWTDAATQPVPTLAARWLLAASGGHDKAMLAPTCEAAFTTLRSGDLSTFLQDRGDIAMDATIRDIARQRFVIRQLAACHLAGLSPQEVAQTFLAAPQVWSASISCLLREIVTEPAAREPYLAALFQDGGEAGLRAVLLAAEFVAPDSSLRGELVTRLVQLIEQGALSPRERVRAGALLASAGDPRDLEALAIAPPGQLTFGSNTHPNSRPPHQLHVDGFRIGKYPVTNRLYAAFIDATGRHWASPDGRLPARSNAPVVDVTWRDARAFCVWLTDLWRAQGRIDGREIVRLPTEPEWERAARGDQPDAGERIVYPWGLDWSGDCANCEDTGLNDTCAVGLFPRGRSPFGCYDMAGQVWEWTTTLWGSDMATPSFAYPYEQDGREDPDAPANIRRVLRGGCFSSGAAKACTTYRGSLEPDGFWRGNGFRIVVAREGNAPA